MTLIMCLPVKQTYCNKENKILSKFLWLWWALIFCLPVTGPIILANSFHLFDGHRNSPFCLNEQWNYQSNWRGSRGVLQFIFHVHNILWALCWLQSDGVGRRDGVLYHVTMKYLLATVPSSWRWSLRRSFPNRAVHTILSHPEDLLSRTPWANLELCSYFYQENGRRSLNWALSWHRTWRPGSHHHRPW